MFHVYEPETVRALSQALNAGLEQVERTSPDAFLPSGRPALIKSLVSNLMMAADVGETDPETLRAIALDWAESYFPPKRKPRVA